MTSNDSANDAPATTELPGYIKEADTKGEHDNAPAKHHPASASADEPVKADRLDNDDKKAKSEEWHELHRAVDKFPGLSYALAFAGLGYVPRERGLFLRYIWPGTTFVLLAFCNVQWQLIILVASGYWGLVALLMQLLTLLNWAFVKKFVCSGALGLTLQLTEIDPAFNALVTKYIRYTMMGIVPSMLVSAGLGNYLVYATYWSSFGYSSVNEPYIVYPTGPIIWHIMMTIGSPFWASTLQLFFTTYIVVCESHRHEITTMSSAVSMLAVSTHEAVDWHKGIAQGLKNTNELFTHITAPYLVLGLSSMLFYAAFGITRSGASQLQVICAACLLTMLTLMLILILVPAARITAAAERVHETAADTTAGIFAQRASRFGGALNNSSTVSPSESGHGLVATMTSGSRALIDSAVSQTLGQRSVTSIGAAEAGRARGQVLRSGATKIRSLFAKHYRWRANKLDEIMHAQSETDAAEAAATWTTENSTYVLAYLRSANCNFQIMGRTISHQLNINILYTFASLIFLFSRLQ